jgi:hypothetical protein
MAKGVKADLHSAGHELSYVVCADARIFRIRPQRVREPGRHPIALLGRHRFDHGAELADRIWSNAERGAADQRSHVFGAKVECALKPLPPELEGRLEGCAAQEKGRGDTRTAQDRQSDRDMRPEIIVKGNGDGKAVSSSPRTRRCEELRSWNDSVARAEVLDLLLEKWRWMWPDEISRSVRPSLTYTVVDECETGLLGWDSSHPLDNRCERLTEREQE